MVACAARYRAAAISGSPVAGELVLARGGLDALDRVEVAVLADERRAERGDQPVGRAARGEVRGGERPRLVHLLLLVEQAR